MSQRLLLIVNPHAAAGRAGERLASLLAELGKLGIGADHVVTTRPGHALELARAASRDYERIAAVGGDGTVNEVASGILLGDGARAALGVVPLGTGNDVAQLLGVGSLPDAINALAHGPARTMDVIEVRCHEAGRPATRYALLFAAAGFAGELLRHTTPRVKRLFGPRYCYSVGFLRAVLSYRAPRLRVSCDGHVSEGRMFLVCAGNAEYAGGGVMRLSPGARTDDGKLNVSVIAALGRLETLRYFPALLKGEHIRHPRVRYGPATSVTIDADAPVPLQVDGDVFGCTPARFLVKARALKVVSAR